MRFFKVLLILLFVVGVVLFGVGMLLSPAFTIVRSVDIQAPPRDDLSAGRRSAALERLVGVESARPRDAGELQRPAERRRRGMGLAQ